jgi:hypothetical protein
MLLPGRDHSRQRTTKLPAGIRRRSRRTCRDTAGTSLFISSEICRARPAALFSAAGAAMKPPPPIKYSLIAADQVRELEQRASAGLARGGYCDRQQMQQHHRGDELHGRGRGMQPSRRVRITISRRSNARRSSMTARPRSNRPPVPSAPSACTQNCCDAGWRPRSAPAIAEREKPISRANASWLSPACFRRAASCAPNSRRRAVTASDSGPATGDHV